MIRQVDDSIILSFILPEKNTDGSNLQEQLSANVLCYAEEVSENDSSPPLSSSEFLKRAKICKKISPDMLYQGNESHRVFLEDRIFKKYGIKAEGKKFYYAIRLMNEKKQQSPLSEIVSLITCRPIPSPINLKAIVLEHGIKLSWDLPNIETLKEIVPLFNIYRIEMTDPDADTSEDPKRTDLPNFFSRAASMDEEMAYLFHSINEKPIHGNEFTDESFLFGKNYLYAVRSLRDESVPYRESENSNIVRISPQDLFAPQSPKGLIAVAEEAVIRLFWYPNSEKDLGGYRIYRESEKQGRFVLIAETLPHITSYTDENVTPGQAYQYYVTSFDSSEQVNESPPANFVSEIAMSPFDHHGEAQEEKYEGE